MPPMREESIGRIHKVSCPCGADVRIDPLKPDRNVTCPRCRLRIDFVVTIDPKSRRPRVSIVVPLNAVKPEGESLAAVPAKTAPRAPQPPPPRTVRAVLAECPCGAAFPVDASKLPGLQSCPRCKTSYHVTLKTEPGTRKKSALLVPQTPAPVPRARASGKTRLGLPPAGPARAETVIPARRGVRTRTIVPPPAKAAPKPPPEVPPGAQAVPCPCGEIHIVRRKDLGHEVPCPTCGRTLRFEEVRDPQTLAPIIRVRTDPAS